LSPRPLDSLSHALFARTPAFHTHPHSMAASGACIHDAAWLSWLAPLRGREAALAWVLCCVVLCCHAVPLHLLLSVVLHTVSAVYCALLCVSIARSFVCVCCVRGRVLAPHRSTACVCLQGHALNRLFVVVALAVLLPCRPEVALIGLRGFPVVLCRQIMKAKYDIRVR
jgi:hypothetical protein